MALRQKTLLLPALLLLATSALAGEKISERRSIDPNGVVRIHCLRGELTIIGWERKEAEIEGELDDLARDLVFETQGADTRISVRMPKEVNRGDGADLVIRLPAGVLLKVDAVSADVNLEDMTGDLAIRTVSGDVEIRAMAGRVHVNTTSGDIEINDGAGMVTITTTSGEISLNLSASDVRVDSVSGDMELELAAFDSVITNAVNAELELEGLLNSGGQIDVRSVNGDVELKLDEPLNARIEVRTGPGGEIENELTDQDPQRLENRGQALDLNLGDSSASVRINTHNGEIKLDRN